MPSFAKPESQASKSVTKAISVGTARHTSRNDGRIHGAGTARNYEQALKLAALWDQANGGQGLAYFDRDRAQAYLSERAESVNQKTLDLDRQALQILPNVGSLDRVRSELNRPGLADQGRAYTPEQVQAIAQAQQPRNALATEIAHAAGIRAHELYTLQPANQRGPSTHREWHPDRFAGRDGMKYTVVGKGGLVREVVLPKELAERLEARRLDAPLDVIDRGIHYEQKYDLGGGQAWSQSFSSASTRELGWSTGAHGLRHSYAQERMEELQRQGYIYHEALSLVSQEMGHFRADITLVYLR